MYYKNTVLCYLNSYLPLGLILQTMFSYFYRVTVQLLEKSIADYRDALTKERKERTELQEKRDALTREIDSFKMSFSRYMNELNRRIDQAKQDQIDLTKEVSYDVIQ